MAKLILATNNQNKLREIREMLSDTGIDSVSLGGLRTPGAFYYMLENMFHRPHNRIIRKISYYSTENIEEAIQMGS